MPRSIRSEPVSLDDLYIAYGKTMHAVQRYEKVLVIAMGQKITLEVFQSPDTAFPEVELATRIYDAASAIPGRNRTIGKTISSHFDADDEMTERLRKTIGDTRNGFAHVFFTADHFGLAKRRIGGKRWLDDHAGRFERVIYDAVHVNRIRLENAGATQETIARVWNHKW